MKRLLGLAIDENLQWAIALANEDGIRDDTIEVHTRPLEDDRDLRPQLVALLDDIRASDQARPPGEKVLNTVAGVGVATIGIVDSPLLQSIPRKPWKRETGSYVLDFRKLLDHYIQARGFDFGTQLLVQNDTSAIALAEFAWGLQEGHIPPETRRLAYLRFDEGVNGGVIHLDAALEADGAEPQPSFLSADRHPELGHLRPRRHTADTAFRAAYSGCLSHTDCYEGIASATRIRRQYAGPHAPKSFTLSDIPLDDRIWEIEADYIAQLCLTCALTIAPQIVLLGGHLIHDELLPKVHAAFHALNGGYLAYPELHPITRFIRPAYFGPEGAVLGALQLAERAAAGRSGIAPTHWPEGVIPMPRRQERS